jgi:cytochrome P450
VLWVITPVLEGSPPYLPVQAVKDDIIPLEFPLPDGSKTVHVRAGQEISITVRDGLNVNPTIWGADADEFRPERWLKEKGVEDRRDLIHAQGNTLSFGDGYALLVREPFGDVDVWFLVRSRICLGRNFGTSVVNLVMNLVLTLVSDCRVQGTVTCNSKRDSGTDKS